MTRLVPRLVQSNGRSVREAGCSPVLVVAPLGTGGTHLSLPQGATGWAFPVCQALQGGSCFLQPAAASCRPARERESFGDCPCRAPRSLPTGSQASKAHTALLTVINLLQNNFPVEKSPCFTSSVDFCWAIRNATCLAASALPAGGKPRGQEPFREEPNTSPT